MARPETFSQICLAGRKLEFRQPDIDVGFVVYITKDGDGQETDIELAYNRNGGEIIKKCNRCGTGAVKCDLSKSTKDSLNPRV